jgi:hypothetical protein
MKSGGGSSSSLLQLITACSQGCPRQACTLDLGLLLLGLSHLVASDLLAIEHNNVDAEWQ